MIKVKRMIDDDVGDDDDDDVVSDGDRNGNKKKICIMSVRVLRHTFRRRIVFICNKRYFTKDRVRIAFILFFFFFLIRLHIRFD
jgi:hypothetical protein